MRWHLLIAFLAACFAPDPVSGSRCTTGARCPNDQKCVGDICVDEDTIERFTLQQPIVPVAYEEAKAACSMLTPPARLAAITNQEENAVAARLAATIPFTELQTNINQRQRLWVGGNSLAEVGVWVWESGVPFSFQNWRVGQPGSPLEERCMVVLGSQDGLWDDRPCEIAYEAFLCERD